MLAALTSNYAVVEALLSLGADPILHHYKSRELLKDEGASTGRAVLGQTIRLRVLAAAQAEQGRHGESPDVKDMVAVLKNHIVDVAVAINNKKAKAEGKERVRNSRNEL